MGRTPVDRVFHIAGIIVLCALLAACSIFPQSQVFSSQGVAPDQVVIVGRIELHPPLAEGEQALKTSRGEDLRNVFLLYCGDRLKDLATKEPEYFEGSYVTSLEKEFYLKVSRGKVLYLSGGIFYTTYDPPDRIEPRVFSSPFQVELRPDDQAVYIGTIQYVRDGSNNLTSVMVRDDHQWAESLFQDRFGRGKRLRKALAIPAACCKEGWSGGSK